VRGEILAHEIFTSTPASGEALGYFNAGGPTKVRLTLLGDTDLNGIVNVADLANLAGNFGTVSGAIWQEGDFDYNGNVNVADLADMAGNFGSSLPGGPSAPLSVAASSASTTTSSTTAATPAAVPAATTTAAVTALAPVVTATPAAQPAALTSSDKDELSITATAPRTASSPTTSGTQSVKIEKSGNPSHHKQGGGKHKGNPLDGLGQL
jgi:hypothetical protein